MSKQLGIRGPLCSGVFVDLLCNWKRLKAEADSSSQEVDHQKMLENYNTSVKNSLKDKLTTKEMDLKRAFSLFSISKPST